MRPTIRLLLFATAVCTALACAKRPSVSTDAAMGPTADAEASQALDTDASIRLPLLALLGDSGLASESIDFGDGGLRGAGSSGVSTVPVSHFIRESDLAVSGHLDSVAVHRRLRNTFAHFGTCRIQAIGRDPKVTGRIDMRFSIERDGTVTRYSSPQNTVKDDAFVACVGGAVKRLKFDQGDGVTVVAYALSFLPPDDGKSSR